MDMSKLTDAELDAMTDEEAWNRCCYVAWIMRRDERRMEPVRQAMHAAQQEVAQAVVEKLAAMSPEERARLLKTFEGG